MKVGEAINRIQSLYSRGAKTSSSRLSDRHIYNMIKSARAVLIKNKRFQGQVAYSTISCMKIKSVSAAECGCSESYGLSFFRSKYKIPTPLMADDYFLDVSSVDNHIGFSQSTWDAVRYNSSSRFSKKEGQWYIKDRYLFVLNNNNLSTLILNGVWFDPVEAAVYNGRETGDCVDAREVDLGVDSELWASIYEIVINEIGMFIQMEEDGTSDSKDRPVK